MECCYVLHCYHASSKKISLFFGNLYLQINTSFIVMIPEEQHNENKEDLKDHSKKHEGDPQEDMEGPVSSLLQRGKETIDKIGDKKGHIEHPQEDHEK